MSAWQIICADWREIGVPPDAAAILTDPPYGIGVTHGIGFDMEAAKGYHHLQSQGDDPFRVKEMIR